MMKSNCIKCKKHWTTLATQGFYMFRREHEDMCPRIQWKVFCKECTYKRFPNLIKKETLPEGIMYMPEISLKTIVMFNNRDRYEKEATKLWNSIFNPK